MSSLDMGRKKNYETSDITEEIEKNKNKISDNESLKDYVDKFLSEYQDIDPEIEQAIEKIKSHNKSDMDMEWIKENETSEGKIITNQPNSQEKEEDRKRTEKEWDDLLKLIRGNDKEEPISSNTLPDVEIPNKDTETTTYQYSNDFPQTPKPTEFSNFTMPAPFETSFEEMTPLSNSNVEEKTNSQDGQLSEESYATLEELEPLLSESGYMCYGHGTGRKGNSDEVVDSIFNEGLRTKNNSLYYTTIALSTPTPELKAQFKEIGMQEPTIEDLKKQFNNWQHQDSKKIIIARIPTEYINKAGDRSDLDGEMFGAFYTQKQQPNGQTTNYLNSKFIIGCYDVEKQAVRLNKNFERVLTPETIEELKENYVNTVEKTNARKERQTAGITQEEINHANQEQQVIDNYKFDSYDSFDDETEWNNSKSDQEEINKLKDQIQQYDNQIALYIANMQPYMQVPKVNEEISKVVAKNNEINQSQIVDSLADYQRVVEIKQSLVSYLEKANAFIKDNVENRQQPSQIVEQNPTDVLNDPDTWAWMNQPQQDKQEQQTETVQQSFEELMSEFDIPSPQQPQSPPTNLLDEFDINNVRLTTDDMYNKDGTYTMLYMMKLATTPDGIDYKKLDELSKANDDIRKGIIPSPLAQVNDPRSEQIREESQEYLKKTNMELDAMIQAMENGTLDTNGNPLVENQMYNGRQLGFIKVGILGIISVLVSIGIIVLAVIFNR